jgi:hypothetical protein
MKDDIREKWKGNEGQEEEYPVWVIVNGPSILQCQKKKKKC